MIFHPSQETRAKCQVRFTGLHHTQQVGDAPGRMLPIRIHQYTEIITMMNGITKAGLHRPAVAQVAGQTQYASPSGDCHACRFIC